MPKTMYTWYKVPLVTDQRLLFNSSDANTLMRPFNLWQWASLNRILSSLFKRTNFFFLLQINHFRNTHRIHVYGTDVPDPMETFEQLQARYDISARIMSNLRSLNFLKPTAIEMQAIPIMMDVCWLFNIMNAVICCKLSFLLWQIAKRSLDHTCKAKRCPLFATDYVNVSRVVFVIVSGSDGQGGRPKRKWARQK